MELTAFVSFPTKVSFLWQTIFYNKILLKPGEEKLSNFRKFIAGALSGATLTSSIYPLEYIVALLASGGFNGIVECVTKTVKEEGVLGLYKGYVPTVLGIIPYTGTMFWSFSYMKEKYAIKKGKGVTAVETMAIGAIAGAFSQTISYPFDTVRKRISTQSRIGEKKKNYHGMNDAFRKIWRSEGFLGFYRGVILNAIRAGPSQAIQFWMFELVMDMLGGNNAVTK